MSPRETIGSHFVWRKSLEQFSINNKICVLNKRTGARFQTATENIAKINHIYDLNDITQKEKQVLKELAKRSSSFPETFMSDMIDDFVAYINSDISKLFSRQNIPDGVSELILAWFDSSGLKRNNSQELLFTFYEQNFIPLYECLLKKDCSFLPLDVPLDVSYNNYVKTLIARMKTKWWSGLITTILVKPVTGSSLEVEQNVEGARTELKRLVVEIMNDLLSQPGMDKKALAQFDFLSFLLSQFTRTQRCKNSVIKLATRDNKFSNCGIRPEVSLCYMLHLGMHQIAVNLIKAKFKLVFLVNTTTGNLITGDQPVVNTHAGYGAEDELFEIYYPLSPRLAILYTDRTCYSQGQEVSLRSEDVIQYNRLLMQQCEEYCYCQSQDDLPDPK